jgi:hypothetical protein
MLPSSLSPLPERRTQPLIGNRRPSLSLQLYHYPGRKFQIVQLPHCWVRYDFGWAGKDPRFDPGLVTGIDLLREITNIIASGVERHIAKRELKDEERAKATRYQRFSDPKPFPRWFDALGALGFAKQRKGVQEMVGEIPENDDLGRRRPRKAPQRTQFLPCHARLRPHHSGEYPRPLCGAANLVAGSASRWTTKGNAIRRR